MCHLFSELSPPVASICSPFLNEKRSCYFLNEDTAFAEVQQTADICTSSKKKKNPPTFKETSP